MMYEELIKTRRSIRKFIDKDVPKELIIELIHESTYAPSAGNGQPWKFLVISDRELMRKISDVCKKSLLERIEDNPKDFAFKYSKMLQSESYNIFYNAPSVVFIHGERTLKNLKVDCALAASYFMMAAASRGLGTCWVNFALSIESTSWADEIGLPQGNEIVAPIILGYPENLPAIPKRKEIDVFFL